MTASNNPFADAVDWGDPRQYGISQGDLQKLDEDEELLNNALASYQKQFGAEFPIAVFIMFYKDKPLSYFYGRIARALIDNKPVDYYKEMQEQGNLWGGLGQNEG